MTPTDTATNGAWLTQLRINTRNKAALRDLADGNQLHRTLMRLVPDGLGDRARAEGGLLYRVEETEGAVTVLAQTRHAPLLDRIEPGYADTAVKDMTRFLDGLRPGMHVVYRIAANPVRQYGSLADRQRAQARLGLDRLPPARRVLTGGEADTWWTERAERSGLDVHSVMRSPSPSVHITRKRGDRLVRHRHGITLFQGDATVINADLTRTAIVEGIGRGRSFGAGLLSIAPT